MAAFDYTQKINTLTTVAIDEVTRDLANLVTEGGEKVLKKMQSKGRIFVVNDGEKVQHPVMYGSGSTGYFDPAGLTGATTDDSNALNVAADEIMAMAQFHMLSATRNINYPQAMPAGNFIPYISNAIKMNMMDILNKEECLFLRGEDSGSDTEEAHYPLVGDMNFTTGLPMSLGAVVNGADTGSAIKFAGIDTDDATYANWKPYVGAAGGTSPTFAQWTTALDDAILTASYSETERPDWILTTKTAYSDLLAKLRDKSQINDAVLANLGTTDEIPYAGTFITWSRYLDKDKMWDVTAWDHSSAGTAETPIVGVNTNSLRLNVVAGGGVNDDSLGFVQKVGGTQKHAAKANIFDRVQYKRCWSLDGGRRSFFQIEGATLA